MQAVLLLSCHRGVSIFRTSARVTFEISLSLTPLQYFLSDSLQLYSVFLLVHDGERKIMISSNASATVGIVRQSDGEPLNISQKSPPVPF